MPGLLVALLSLSLAQYTCKSTRAIHYPQLQQTTWNEVTGMDEQSGVCSTRPRTDFPLAEFTFAIRGPMELMEFHHFIPQGGDAKPAQGPAPAAAAAPTTLKKRGIKRRQVKTKIVYETVYVPASSSVAATPAAKQPTPTASAAPKNNTAGAWKKSAEYIAGSQASYGMRFLNNKGGQGSGKFSMKFGNSLSFASADGESGAAAPNVLQKKTLGNDKSLLIYTDVPCDETCGVSFPGAEDVLFKGFQSKASVSFFTFLMPDNQAPSESGVNTNLPAIWALHASIPRNVQYASNKDCSCWSSGCGELDFAEATPNNPSNQLVSQFHGSTGTGKGSCSYFERPVSTPMKMVIIWKDHAAMLLHVDQFPTEVTDEYITQAFASQADVAN